MTINTDKTAQASRRLQEEVSLAITADTNSLNKEHPVMAEHPSNLSNLKRRLTSSLSKHLSKHLSKLQPMAVETGAEVIKVITVVALAVMVVALGVMAVMVAAVIAAVMAVVSVLAGGKEDSVVKVVEGVDLTVNHSPQKSLPP